MVENTALVRPTTGVGFSTAVELTTWFSMRTTSYGGQLTMSTTPGVGRSLGGGSGGLGGILCRGFPTGRPPALDDRTSRIVGGTLPSSGRAAAMGGADAIARVAVRRVRSVGRRALHWVPMGGRIHGGRYGGLEGILCRGFPTGRPPALDGSPNQGLGGRLRLWLPGSIGVVDGSGKGGTMDYA